MKADVRIERATAQNPDDAIRLIEEYYEAVGVVVRDNRSALLAYLSDESSGVWVAYVGGEPAGCILLRPLPNLPESSEIKRLYVRPAYRGYGIASSLVTEIEGFAARRGISTLYLDTKDDLVEAIAFYRKHGYQPCARYNDNPQATIFMRKSIRPA